MNDYWITFLRAAIPSAVLGTLFGVAGWVITGQMWPNEAAAVIGVTTGFLVFLASTVTWVSVLEARRGDEKRT